MSSIVLKIPSGATSFRAGLATLDQSHVSAWYGAAISIDDDLYIPLKTDWMPGRERRTADGVEVLLAGRWPAEVQQAFDEGKAARIGAKHSRGDNQ